MVDLFGPDSVVRAVSVRPPEPDLPLATDTFFGDCVAGVAGTGTPIPAHWLNRITANLRNILRRSSLADTNLDDDALTKSIRSQKMNYPAVSGSANAIALTPTFAFPDLAALVGVPLRFKVATTNTSTVTLNVSSLGAVALKRMDGNQLLAGELRAGAIVEAVYDGTDFRLVNFAGGETTIPRYYIGTWSQSLSNGVQTLITGYTQEDANLGDATFASGLLTVGAQSAGLWIGIFSAISPTAGTDLFATIITGASGGTAIGYSTAQTATSAPGIPAPTVKRLAAGDIIRATARQFSGGSQTVTGRIHLVRIGA